jgi:putative addiction module antidote
MMPILTSRARADGDSVSTTIPAEVIRRMGIKPGDELFWIEDGRGGYHVAASNPERAALLGAHAQIMDEHRDAFAALAK